MAKTPSVTTGKVVRAFGDYVLEPAARGIARYGVAPLFYGALSLGEQAGRAARGFFTGTPSPNAGRPTLGQIGYGGFLEATGRSLPRSMERVASAKTGLPMAGRRVLPGTTTPPAPAPQIATQGATASPTDPSSALASAGPDVLGAPPPPAYGGTSNALTGSPIPDFNEPVVQQTTSARKDFTGAIMDLLKQSQGFKGDADLYTQRGNLINQRNAAVGNMTPEELRNLSPEQQSAIRTGSVSAIDEQLVGIDSALKARETSRDAQLGLAETAYGFVRQEEQDAQSKLTTLLNSYGAESLYAMGDDLKETEAMAGFPIGSTAQAASLKEIKAAREGRKTARDQLIQLGLSLAPSGIILPGLDEAVLDLINEASGQGTATRGLQSPTPYYGTPTNGTSFQKGDQVAVAGKNRYVTSGYLDPSREDHHGGLDLRFGMGEAVTPIVPGQVIFTGDRGDFGNLAVVLGDDGKQYYYGHLSEFAVKVGSRVDVMTTLGKAGSTGKSTGPHLHLEVREYMGDKWTPTDPTTVLTANKTYSYPVASQVGGLGQSLFQSLAGATSKEVDAWVNYIEQGGEPTLINDNNIRGLVIQEMVRRGVKPKPVDNAKKTDLLYLVGDARNKINRFFLEYESVGPTMNGVLGRLEGNMTRFSAWAGTDPRAKAFLDLRSATIGPLARAISRETGVLNEGDLRRADGLLPRLTDTPDEIKFKKDLIGAILDEGEALIKGAPPLSTFEG